MWLLSLFTPLHASSLYPENGEYFRFYAGPTYGSIISNGLTVAANIDGSSLALKPHSTCGFIVGTSLLTDTTHWDVDLSYSYQASEASVDKSGTYLPRYTTSFLTFAPMHAAANGSFDLKLLSLMLSAPVSTSQSMKYAAGFGLAGMWNGEEIYIRYTPNTSYSTDLNYIMRSIGIRFGNKLAYHFLPSVSLQSDVGIANHFTRTRSRRTEKTADVIDLRCERSDRFSTLVIDTKWFFRGEHSYGKIQLAADCGIFLQTIPSGAQYLLPSSMQQEGTLGSHGFFFTLSLGF